MITPYVRGKIEATEEWCRAALVMPPAWHNRKVPPAMRDDSISPRTCRACGKVLVLRPTEAKSHFAVRRHCDRKCSAQATWGNHVPERVELVCKQCGKPFLARPSALVSKYGYPKLYCSRACLFASRRGEGRTVACEQCGKTFHERKPSARRRFCSQSCGSLFRLKQHREGPTSLERTVYEALTTLGIEYVPQHRIGHYVVDAFLPSLNVLLECQGDYFHCNPNLYPDGPIDAIQRQNQGRDARRFTALTKLGYCIVEVWEHDIKVRGAVAVIEDAIFRRVAPSG